MKFHWAAAATLVSASNAKVGSWKIQQNHGSSLAGAETSQAGDSHLRKISASNTVQQAPVHPIGSTSWYPGKYGLLKNIVIDRVPCDPNHDDVSKNDPDVGILGCEPGLVCQEDPFLDGSYHCVSEDETLHASRKLDDFYGDCDYSDFDEATYVGTVVCTYPDTCGDEYGLSETTCARLIISTTYNGSPYDTTAGPYCYNIFEGEYDADSDIVEVCFVPDSMDSCSLAIGEDDCNACTVIGAGTSDGCVSMIVSLKCICVHTNIFPSCSLLPFVVGSNHIHMHAT